MPSNYSQTIPGSQLPPCVPMNPATKTRSVAKKTERELLQSKAEHIGMASAIEATASHPFYDIKAYDRENDVVLLQQAMYPQNDPYRVDRKNLTCTCIHFTGAVTKTNKALAEAGLMGGLLCKHFAIIDEKEFANPSILDEAPTTWKRKRAAPSDICIVSASSHDEFIEGDF